MAHFKTAQRIKREKEKEMQTDCVFIRMLDAPKSFVCVGISLHKINQIRYFEQRYENGFIHLW